MNRGLIYILGPLKKIKANSGMILNCIWEGFFVCLYAVEAELYVREAPETMKRCRERKED